MRLHIGEAAAEQLGHPVDGKALGDVDELATAVIAPAGRPSAYLLVRTEPCASSTARLTMFSDAISSISSRCRPSSSLIASAISRSVSASEASKKTVGLGRRRGIIGQRHPVSS
jgi:hypothetical protein